MAVQANNREVEIVWDKQGYQNAFVDADEKRIQSVIENLLDNAIKYSKQGGLIRIDTTQDTNQLVIKITDSGIGIPEKSKSDIFKRFFRAPNAIRTHANGSGLGLFIAKNILKRHHGDISFISSENKGTKFTLTIPIKQPEDL